MGAYEASVKAEKLIYENCTDVHRLPEIFHYWSNRHIKPQLLPFGFNSPNDLFRKFLNEHCERKKNAAKRFVSLGAGNCDLEIEIVRQLRARGHDDFTLDCLDLNATMLERGRAAAQKCGVASYLSFVEGDFNAWSPAHEYDAAIANQSLHHVVNLEDLFAQVKRSLLPGGSFIISDMIGRNGHQRWPEALSIVREFWRKLPPSYRLNRQIGLYQETYEDWDCSVEGFEGVRSQDILPLLLRDFHFRFFLPFANVIDPFVDRSFGPNFDAAAQWDRDFIDEVHRRDELELCAGRLKPTHMLAVAVNEPDAALEFRECLTPEFCVRAPENISVAAPFESADPYLWGAWPHDPQDQLEIVCRSLGDAGEQIKQRTEWALRFERELQDRTAWALRLEKESEERAAWALRLDRELAERTTWALRLDDELRETISRAGQLQKDVDERTAWALKLDTELKEMTAWALSLREELDEESTRRKQLEGEIDRYLNHPLQYARQLAAGLKSRVARVLFKH